MAADAGGGETRNTISGGIFFSAVIQGRDITVKLPPEIIPALSGLPSGTPAFAGRETELHTLLNVLAPRTEKANDGEAPGSSQAPTAVIAAVDGLAGIGKTELAIQAARAALHRGWFPAGVLFVDLFGYDPARSLDPGQALEGFLLALAVPTERIPAEIQDRVRLYASVLAAYAHEGRRILVVIDNAATHEQAISLLPTEPPHAAIVTSRDTLGLLHARLLDLDILTTENAADMLDSALRVARPGDTRATDHPDDAARIAELCKGLPLALRIISALLSENLRRPLSEMAADLNDERTRLDELSYGDTTVRAAFDLSYRRLDQAHARLFRLLTIIPEPDISTLTTAALADLDERAARRGLEALARAHFIGPGGSYGRWRMHDLLRLYAQQLSDAHAGVDGREQAQDRLLSYYQENLGPALRQVRRSAETTTAHQEMATIFRETGDRRNEGMALNNTGVALQQVGRFAEAITAWQETAAIFRETGDRYLQGMAVDNLGLGSLGDRGL